jgi:hypothetical protein
MIGKTCSSTEKRQRKLSYKKSKMLIQNRVFSEVPFWNSAEYGILYGIGFIPRNFLLFNSAEFRRIPYRFVYTEFRIPLNENTITEPITKDL